MRIRQDKARTAVIFATSEQEGYEAKNVISGVTRREGENSNLWCSDGIGPNGEQLTLTLAEQASVSQIRLTFDPDLSEERCITVSKAFIEKQPKGVAKTLVKDYTVELLSAGQVIAAHSVSANHQRLNVIDLENPVVADAVRVTVHSTNGCPDARIYEVRIY
ncbi:MAG: hypothetical protein ACOX0K_09810 [Oscillospiraceae bacterium]